MLKIYSSRLGVFEKTGEKRRLTRLRQGGKEFKNAHAAVFTRVSPGYTWKSPGSSSKNIPKIASDVIYYSSTSNSYSSKAKYQNPEKSYLSQSLE